ncbi:uncharacterized protein PAC_17043 [Phialocephala subalpina]|uniref:Uncharacterized protein n=1 Tax=Phialocephala subalpina TaxID=576137 RepID=A0A1L7XQ28_9HELO|nr:uncharacterized protein PAC_17043 [Phialocephala subalpina]
MDGVAANPNPTRPKRPGRNSRITLTEEQRAAFRESKERMAPIMGTLTRTLSARPSSSMDAATAPTPLSGDSQVMGNISMNDRYKTTVRDEAEEAEMTMESPAGQTPPPIVGPGSTAHTASQPPKNSSQEPFLPPKQNTFEYSFNAPIQSQSNPFAYKPKDKNNKPPANASMKSNATSFQDTQKGTGSSSNAPTSSTFAPSVSMPDMSIPPPPKSEVPPTGTLMPAASNPTTSMPSAPVPAPRIPAAPIPTTLAPASTATSQSAASASPGRKRNASIDITKNMPVSTTTTTSMPSAPPSLSSASNQPVSRGQTTVNPSIAGRVIRPLRGAKKASTKPSNQHHPNIEPPNIQPPSIQPPSVQHLTVQASNVKAPSSQAPSSQTSQNSASPNIQPPTVEDLDAGIQTQSPERSRMTQQAPGASTSDTLQKSAPVDVQESREELPIKNTNRPLENATLSKPATDSLGLKQQKSQEDSAVPHEETSTPSRAPENEFVDLYQESRLTDDTSLTTFHILEGGHQRKEETTGSNLQGPSPERHLQLLGSSVAESQSQSSLNTDIGSALHISTLRDPQFSVVEPRQEEIIQQYPLSSGQQPYEQRLPPKSEAGKTDKEPADLPEERRLPEGASHKACGPFGNVDDSTTTAAAKEALSEGAPVLDMHETTNLLAISTKLSRDVTPTTHSKIEPIGQSVPGGLPKATSKEACTKVTSSLDSTTPTASTPESSEKTLKPGSKDASNGSVHSLESPTKSSSTTPTIDGAAKFKSPDAAHKGAAKTSEAFKKSPSTAQTANKTARADLPSATPKMAVRAEELGGNMHMPGDSSEAGFKYLVKQLGIRNKKVDLQSEIIQDMQKKLDAFALEQTSLRHDLNNAKAEAERQKKEKLDLKTNCEARIKTIKNDCHQKNQIAERKAEARVSEQRQIAEVAASPAPRVWPLPSTVRPLPKLNPYSTPHFGTYTSHVPDIKHNITDAEEKMYLDRHLNRAAKAVPKVGELSREAAASPCFCPTSKGISCTTRLAFTIYYAEEKMYLDRHLNRAAKAVPKVGELSREAAASLSSSSQSSHTSGDAQDTEDNLTDDDRDDTSGNADEDANTHGGKPLGRWSRLVSLFSSWI